MTAAAPDALAALIARVTADLRPSRGKPALRLATLAPAPAIQPHKWTATRWVAAIRCRTCLHCGLRSRYWDGWYTEHSHQSDPHAHRLTPGRSGYNLPSAVRETIDTPSEACPGCINLHLHLDRPPCPQTSQE